jgi:hypothetical protein
LDEISFLDAFIRASLAALGMFIAVGGVVAVLGILSVRY